MTRRIPLEDLTAEALHELYDRLEEAEYLVHLRRWSPEEVIALHLLPYTSVRVLKQKCYAREIHHHNDGGRITFTLDDIRAENDRTQITPEKGR
ncbi:hypothetical protein [Streptomyces sp.]|uniref:hypothetical protein n=1 Tax=Streptomyces sp. TaxID=1931 RepID=UPI002810E527|nr:hypothetical protein [Streptomyces sp.]